MTPAARSRASSPWALQPRTFMPMPLAITASRAPMAPMPKTPSVLPSICVSISRGHLPSRISRSSGVILRPTASMRVSACSATAKALTPGVLQMVTPRMPAAFRSKLSVPVPHTETSLSFGHRREDRVGEPRVGADVDGDPRVADAPDQLVLLVGAALGEHAHVAERLRALVGRRAVEHRREVVGNDDHAPAPAKTAWAAATPAPASRAIAQVAQRQLERRRASAARTAGST